MKNILIVLSIFTVSIANSVGQVITFKLDTIYCFKHDANITTDYAMRHDLVTLTGSAHPKSTFSFDFENMILTCTDNNGVHQCPITEKNIIDKEQKTFRCVFISYDTHNHLDVILSTGQNESDGYVVYIRSRNKEKGTEVINGCFATKVWVN